MAGQCPDCGNAPPNCPTCWRADQREIERLTGERDAYKSDAELYGQAREALDSARAERDALKAEADRCRDLARAPVREWLEHNKDEQVRALFEENKARDVEIAALKAELARLRAIEAAAKAWVDDDDARMGAGRDTAYVLASILASRKPEGDQ